MSFDWQTEEDFNWDEELTSPESPEPQRRRWPWFVLVGVLLMGTAVFILTRQLNQSVETATDGVEANLIASYAVLQQAVQNKDQNLFSSLLSGREPDWSFAQQDNLRAGLMFDRPGFGLEWQPGLAETAVFSQTLSPDLTAAELTTLQNYSLEIGNGLTQTVQLERVDVYRLGEDRWLLAPPEREFWGVRQRLEGQLLSVRYPARDEKIVHRLAADLEAKLVQVCNTPGYTCPSEARVRVVFSPEPESLTEATFMGALTRRAQGDIWTGGQAVRLPTPSLVGLPQDEVGYQALFRGYAQQLLMVAINDLIDWECCQNMPYHRAVVTHQLYELGVGNWPLVAPFSVPRAVDLPGTFNLGNGALYWNAPFPENPTDFAQTPAPYVVVDFLINDLHLTTQEIMTSLITSEVALFGQWLAELTGPPWTEATLNHAFQKYVARWQDEPEVIAQPDSDLVLLCQDTVSHALGLYQFNFSQEIPLLLENLTNGDVFFTGLPNGSGMAVAGLGSNREPETYLLQNGEPRIAVDWSNVEGLVSYPPLAVPTTTDPNGRYLLWTLTPGYTTGNFFALTDLTTCHEGDSCEAISIGGYPIWSPTSEQLITLTVTNPWWGEAQSNGLMLLRDQPTDEAINSPGFGASVFWLDETQFGYLTQGQNSRQQVELSDIALSNSSTMLTNESLLAFYPDEERPDSIRLEFVQPLPTNPEILVVVAKGDSNISSEASTGSLFWYDRSSASVTLRVPLEGWHDSELLGVRFSPDGRSMLIAYTDSEETAVNLFIQNVDGPRFSGFRLLGNTNFPRHFYASWSPDGQWLAMPELGYIRLWHNGWDEQLLNFDNLDCTNAAWVARMER